MGKEGEGTVKKVESSLTLHRRRRRHRARRRWFHKKLFLPPSLFHTFFRWIKGGRIGRGEAKKKSHQGKVSEEKSATTFFPSSPSPYPLRNFLLSNFFWPFILPTDSRTSFVSSPPSHYISCMRTKVCHMLLQPGRIGTQKRINLDLPPKKNVYPSPCRTES